MVVEVQPFDEMVITPKDRCCCYSSEFKENITHVDTSFFTRVSQSRLGLLFKKTSLNYVKFSLKSYFSFLLGAEKKPIISKSKHLEEI